MNDNKNEKSKVWLYAVVLFTSAFIVLLLTAYSQIKLNSNLSNYKNQISIKETEKNKYQLSFVNAQDINKKLNEENKKLQADIKNIEDELKKLNEEKLQMEDDLNNKITVNELLCEAQSEYLKGNIVNCAGLIKEIDINNLNTKAMEMYNLLSQKAFVEAGKLLFDEGYKLYGSRNYAAAADKFLQSREYSVNSDYSDRCLYYLAYSKLRTGSITEAVGYMDHLLQDYPDSKYKKSAGAFIKKYRKTQP